ncbi:MAG: hypothetical protein JWM11_7472, partial [Planctomycetaceae bacterium]|nr:hypothetical protein [Planctomycetaceae bacterium]
VTPNLDGAVGVTLAANSVQDAATNGNFGASAAVTVDRTAPSLNITPNGTASNASPIVFTFQFTEPVTGFTASDVVLTNGSPGTFTAVDASTYTLQVTPTVNGPVQVNVAAGVAQDSATNVNSAASASETSDRTNPGLSIAPNGAISNAGSILFTFQFTEPVTGFSLGDISLTNGQAGTFTAIDGDTYTLAVTPILDGTVAVNVAANAARDPATNGNTAASVSVTSDRTNPGLSITPNGSATNSSSVLMTFQFTEPVTGFTLSDISITNGTAGTFTAVDGDTYTLLVSPTSDGLVSTNVGTNAAQDIATNGNLAASATFTSDRTAPGLTITPNGSLTNSSPISFTFQFTEPVSGFAANDIALTNGSAGVFATVDAETYTLLVTPLANGVVSVAVGANLAVDVASNGNTATSASITSDRTAPTATVASVSPNSRTTLVDNLTIVFSEPITGFGINDLVLTRNGGANLLTAGQTLTTTDNMTFNLGNLGGLTEVVGNYTLRLNATGSGIQDPAGNALPTDATTTWARVNPVVTLSLNNASIPEAAGTAVLTATLSAITDVDVTVGLTFTGTASFPQDYSRSASQIVIPAGSMSATITLTAVSDSELEANESIIINSSSVTNGTTFGPLQAIIQILDDDHAPVFTSPAAVSFAENSVTPININATDADLPAQTISYTLSGGVDRARFTLSSDGKLAFVAAPDFENPTDIGLDNVYNVQIRADDGHAGVTLQNLAITVTDVDEIPPTVSIVPVSITPRSAPVAAVTIVFSEAVSGFDLSDVLLIRSGGNNLLTGAQSLSTNDNVTFTLSGLSSLTNADGVYFLTVPQSATGIVDLAGNALAGGASTNWTTDVTPPSAVIAPVSPDPRYTPVSSVNIVFQERVSGFLLSDLSLTHDGGQNLLSGTQTLTTVDNITYTLGNLTGITGNLGDYVLSLQPANSSIQDQVGNMLVDGATDEWIRATPEVTLSMNTASIAEAAGTATVTASLPAATDVDVTVVLGFSGTANFPADYTRGATQIVIPAGSTSNSVVLTAVQDAEFEPTESIIVNITSVANGVQSGTQQVQTEIIDDDHAPVFTSAATASIPENTTVIMTVIATDADLPAQTIGYTITGGLDQSLFAISSSGVLSFLTAPNFELPTDIDHNNIYNVQVTANDSHGGMTSQNISVTVTNVNEPPTLSLGGPVVTWINKKPAVVALPQITATAEGSLAGGTLTISVNAVGTKKKLLDIFGIPNSTALGSGSGPHVALGQLTLQISLQESATTSGIEAFLHGITFATKGKGLKLLTRSMDVTLTDAHGLSSTVRQTINVKKKA